jgi:hypothetical protein
VRRVSDSLQGLAGSPAELLDLEKGSRMLSYHRRAAIAFAACALGFAVPATATDWWWTSTLSKVYPLQDGSVVLIFAADSPNCPAAGPGKYHYIAVGSNGVTSDGLKAMLATSLTAFAAGRQVTINFSDSSPTACYINRLFIQ